jgi:predicted acetyltransferase
MNVRELAQRMTGWLASGEYSAILFEDEKKEVVAYALYREQQQPAEIYLRQFFVTRHRRRQSLGRKAFLRLRELWPKNRRITVEVLAGNKPALEFFRSVGYVDYSVALEIMPAAVPH